MVAIRTIVITVFGCFALAGCGKSSNLGNGTIAIQNGNFVSAMSGVAYFSSPAMTEFKVCIARVKLEDEDGKCHVNSPSGDDSSGGVEVESGDESAEIRFTPGLIDLSAGEARTFGNLKIPTGFSVKYIKIKVRKDRDLCGVDYSVRFNGRETQQDVEFKFKFVPALAITAATRQLELSFLEVVAALRTAAEAGDLARMKDHIEAAEGKGSDDSAEAD